MICNDCGKKIKGVKKFKIWNGRFLPVCHNCWVRFINQ